MRSFFTLIILCGLTLMQAKAEGIVFFNGTFEQALAEAQSQGKLIFMDAYAEWCGPCKNMAKYVFTRDDVGEFYNKSFINMKIDMEKGEGRTLAQKYRVSAYPTFFFIDGEGKVVMNSKGSKQPAQFINLGKAALKKYDKSGELAEKYEAGDHSPELLRKYAYALVQSNKEHLKIANEYFDTQKDLTTPTNLKAIFDFALEADSKIFNLLLQHKTEIIALKSEKEVLDRIQESCLATVRKAGEYQFPSLVDEAKDLMQKHHSKAAKTFNYEADLIYSVASNDVNAFNKVSKKYAQKVAQKDANLLNDLAEITLASFSSDKKAMKNAEKFAKKATELNNNTTYLYNYALILYKNKKLEPALRIAKKAMDVATKKGESTSEIDELLRLIKP